jgi:hypothetical protein
MKPLLIALIMLFTTALFAQIESPQTHISIMLDGKVYEGDRANDGGYDYANRFQLRKAELGFEGSFNDRIEYSVALGMCTCSGSSSSVDIMEAEIMYSVLPQFQLGIAKGHVNRGFAALTECGARLASEKPNFTKTFGTCHPMGFVADYQLEFGSNASLETEIAYMNGTNDTMNKEHDINFGFMLLPPITGLSVSGLYNHTNRKYYDSEFNPYYKVGQRYGCGLEYIAHSVWLTGEYQRGKGFDRPEQKMQAWYAQLGYEVKTKLATLPAIQPYALVETWNKDIESSLTYRFIETGITLKTSGYTQIRLAYKSNIETPLSNAKEPDLYLLRLQYTL